MKTTLFTYSSPVGTFWIRPELGRRVQLGIDRQKLRTYPSPTAAARDVATRATGYAPWDSATGILAPPGLQKWKRGSRGGRPQSDDDS